ncbi:MAG: hypothetical protein CL608_18470 [Anaerolineaceae bacterium]|nr:hypothetical protein [Anaerolineaceae bacterium]
MIKPSLQDFSTIRSHLKRYQEDYGKNAPDAFYYFVLSLILDLQDDEIEDAITDNNYLTRIGPAGGHDRGIDAVYIDDSDSRPTIHFFNCKYTDSFKKTSNHFPSGEIDKMLMFLNDLMSQDEGLKDTVNPILFGKVLDIWKIFENTNPNFEIHLCTNQYNGLEAQEKERFERGIHQFSNFSINYHLMGDLINRLTRKDKQIVNACLKAIDKNYFEKSGGGDIRALVVDVDARDLIRIVLDNENLRGQSDLDDYSTINDYSILEDSFEDNVRVYLKQRSKINRSIRATALSIDNHRFFYFNNGITITCEKFEYRKGRAPVIELKNLQVVNGSQTIHALYDAFKEDPGKFEEIDILIRIYETKNAELTTRIAEYTNSQNPVSSRDIRSIDFMQQKLETEFKALGLFYERKRNQYSGSPKAKRIDAAKTGQVLFAFYNGMPAEAKNKKRLIFAEKYEDIFNDNINADKVLLAYRLFERIEKEKNDSRVRLIALTDADRYEEESFILHASYYILFLIRELGKRDSITLEFSNLDQLWELYPGAVKIIKELIDEERDSLTEHRDKYNHAAFFKSNKPKKLFEDRWEKSGGGHPSDR